MGTQGFYRGTTHDQVSFFPNKEKKMIEGKKWPPEYEKEVDISKVNMEIISTWVQRRITELLGVEDEIVVDYCKQQLNPPEDAMDPQGVTSKKICPKKLQINLTGFLAKNSAIFVKELWSLLLSAQESPNGIPQQFLNDQSLQLQTKQEEARKIKEVLEQEYNNSDYRSRSSLPRAHDGTRGRSLSRSSKGSRNRSKSPIRAKGQGRSSPPKRSVRDESPRKRFYSTSRSPPRRRHDSDSSRSTSRDLRRYRSPYRRGDRSPPPRGEGRYRRQFSPSRRWAGNGGVNNFRRNNSFRGRGGRRSPLARRRSPPSHFGRRESVSPSGRSDNIHKRRESLLGRPDESPARSSIDRLRKRSVGKSEGNANTSDRKRSQERSTSLVRIKNVERKRSRERELSATESRSPPMQRQISVSPTKKSTSRKHSPEKKISVSRSRSPIRGRTCRGRSPPRRGRSPLRRGRSPLRRGRSPLRRGRSPPRRGRSPPRRGRSPMRDRSLMRDRRVDRGPPPRRLERGGQKNFTRRLSYSLSPPQRPVESRVRSPIRRLSPKRSVSSSRRNDVVRKTSVSPRTAESLERKPLLSVSPPPKGRHASPKTRPLATVAKNKELNLDTFDRYAGRCYMDHEASSFAHRNKVQSGLKRATEKKESDGRVLITETNRKRQLPASPEGPPAQRRRLSASSDHRQDRSLSNDSATSEKERELKSRAREVLKRKDEKDKIH